MRITSWNCLGPRYNYDNETQKWLNNISWLKEFYPANLYVIQECSKLQIDLVRQNGLFNYAAWYGDDLDYFMRGTAILSDTRYFTEREEFFHNPNFRYVVPYHIKNIEENLDFILYNVWTKAKPIKKAYENIAYFFYENNVKEAIKYYTNLHDSLETIAEMPKTSLLLGDFNFGKDDIYVKNSFSKFLLKYNFKLSEGLEDNLCTYIDSKGNKFLNDYCFTQNLSSKLIEKGSFECIKDKSDHIPLIFEITK